MRTAWAACFVAASCLVILLVAGSARGDMGAVAFVPTVKVFEPNQRALIAWNGEEEILILSTDLKASAPTKVLEVMPFPSKPTVQAGDVKVFEKAIKLINDAQKPRMTEIAAMSAEGGGGEVGGATKVTPAAELAFHEKIGATDINVIHVLKADGFIDWVEKYLKKQGVKEVAIPDVLKKSVGEYLQDGCQWFAFNVVSLEKEPRSKHAVEYRFVSDCLYYPLRISRTDEGETIVSLLVVTKDMLNRRQFAALPWSKLEMPCDVATVDAEHLADLHVEIHKLLGRPASAKLRIWELHGSLGSFDQDLVAGKPPRFTLNDPATGKAFGPAELRTGSKIEIGNQAFTVDVGSMPTPKSPKDRFHLKSDTRLLGSYEFEEGAKVKVLNATYTLQMAPTPIGRLADK